MKKKEWEKDSLTSHMSYAVETRFQDPASLDQQQRAKHQKSEQLRLKLPKKQMNLRTLPRHF